MVVRTMMEAAMVIEFVLLLSAWLWQAPRPASAQAPSLDFATFRDQVQPIFLAKRPGHARCVTCHSTGTPMRLQPLPPGGAKWTEEQSRKNFEVVLREVQPGNPAGSRLLIHPLAMDAGGDHFHNGGKHWTSQSDPEWQALAAWVRGHE